MGHGWILNTAVGKVVMVAFCYFKKYRNYGESEFDIKYML
jgi:hypothetical protein